MKSIVHDCKANGVCVMVKPNTLVVDRGVSKHLSSCGRWSNPRAQLWHRQGHQCPAKVTTKQRNRS